MSKDFNDGVCDNCGNTGLAGEKCLVCGGMLSKIDDSANDPIVNGDMDDTGKEPEVYPLDLVDKENEDLLPEDDLM